MWLDQLHDVALTQHVRLRGWLDQGEITAQQRIWAPLGPLDALSGNAQPGTSIVKQGSMSNPASGYLGDNFTHPGQMDGAG